MLKRPTNTDPKLGLTSEQYDKLYQMYLAMQVVNDEKKAEKKTNK